MITAPEGAHVLRDDGARLDAWLLREFADQADFATAPDQLDELAERIAERFGHAEDPDIAKVMRRLDKARDRLRRLDGQCRADAGGAGGEGQSLGVRQLLAAAGRRRPAATGPASRARGG